MAYFSHCFLVVSVALLLQFLPAPASDMPYQSSPYIEKLCGTMSSMGDRDDCLLTLTEYQGAVHAGDSATLAEFVITDLIVPHVRTAVRYALRLTSRKESPSLKAQFVKSHLILRNIGDTLGSAYFVLRVSPRAANHEVLTCPDQINKIMYMIGKNQDVASKTLIKLIMQMKNVLHLGVAATQALLR